jgi:hypothetical protein
MFGLKERERIDCGEERKHGIQYLSTVWIICQRGKKAEFLWVPPLETFPPRSGKKAKIGDLI